jgi:hypothetical protein
VDPSIDISRHKAITQCNGGLSFFGNPAWCEATKLLLGALLQTEQGIVHGINARVGTTYKREFCAASHIFFVLLPLQLKIKVNESVVRADMCRVKPAPGWRQTRPNVELESQEAQRETQACALTQREERLDANGMNNGEASFRIRAMPPPTQMLQYGTRSRT